MRESARNLLGVLCIVTAACSGEKSPQNTASNASAAATPSPASTPAASSENKPTAQSYVGQNYDPLPPGVTYESGSVIIGPDGKPSRYVLSHVGTPRGMMLWLDSLTPIDGGVVRRRIIRAAMDDPKRAVGERLVIGTCDVKGKLDGGIVALVLDTVGTKYTNIHRAWRADMKAARFDSIETTGITCEEPGAR